MVNGVAAGSPGNVSCTIDTTHANCADTTNTATVSAGDLLSWRFFASGTPTAQTAIQLGSTFTSSANGLGAIFTAQDTGAAANPSTTAVNYAPFGGSALWNATEAIASSLIPTGGAIDGLYVFAFTPAGAGVQTVFTVFHGGSRTSLTCTLAGAGSGAGITRCNDPAGGGHGFAVSAGDTISLESCPGTVSGSCTPATSATAVVKYVVQWTPTIAGEAVVSEDFQLGISTTAARFLMLNDAGASASATETNNQQVIPIASTVHKLFVKTDGALSGTQTRTQTLRLNATTDEALTCPLNSTNTTTCNDTTHTYGASAGDLLSWRTSPANTPAAETYLKIGAVITAP